MRLFLGRFLVSFIVWLRLSVEMRLRSLRWRCLAWRRVVAQLSNSSFYCEPKVLGESPKMENSPRVVRRGCKRCFGPRAPNASCIGQKKGANRGGQPDYTHLSISSETGRIRFRTARFQTPSLSTFFGPHRVPGRELSEFPLSLLFVCQSELTEFFFSELTEFAPKLSGGL